MRFVPLIRPPAGRQSVCFHPGIDPEFGYRCTGDCMIPTFYPGEIAYIHGQSDFDDGQVVAVEVDGWRMLKRAFHIPGGVRFVPDNPAYKPFQYTGSDAEAVRIIGIAVARGCQQS